MQIYVPCQIFELLRRKAVSVSILEAYVGMFGPPLFLAVSGRCLRTTVHQWNTFSLRLDRAMIGSELAVISAISDAHQEADEISTKYIRLKIIGHASSPTSHHLNDPIISIHNHTMRFTITVISVILLSISAIAGPIAWGLCQSACNAGWGSCCIGAGGIAGK
jgi:hypothetical protein